MARCNVVNSRLQTATVAVTVSLWDHVIRFGQEFELLWRQRKTVHTMLLMFDMYGVEGSMIYFAFARTHFPSLQWSEKTFVRYDYSIWEYTGRSASEALNCYASMFLMIYKALFDLHVIALLVVSTLGRPRRNDAEIVNNLKRDGFLAFLAVLGLRLIPFIQNMLENASQTFTSLLRTIWNAGLWVILGFLDEQTAQSQFIIKLPVSGESMNETLQKCVSRFDTERDHPAKPVSESGLSRALVAVCRVINRAVAKLPGGGEMIVSFQLRLDCRPLLEVSERLPYHLSDLTMATDIETLAGGYFIEVLLAIMLYGVAITQAYAYWWDYPNDSKRLRWTIVIPIFAAMYEYLIIDFNDIEKIQTIVCGVLNSAHLDTEFIRLCKSRMPTALSGFKLGSWKLYRDTKMTYHRPYDQVDPDVCFAGDCYYLHTITFLATLNARQRWRSRRRYGVHEIVSMELSPRVTSAQAQGNQASQIEILTMVSKVTDNMLYHEHGVPKPPVSGIVIEPSKNQILKDDD
ncbi:predicted protein [Postia placenta Mad-698-R]|nr:predicted protein [Postia placenta Mad-698-R]